MFENRLCVAILGMGIMGQAMAQTAIDNGFDVVVYNRDPKKISELEGKFIVARSPAEAACRANVIVSMLADDNACRNVWLGKGGAIQGAWPGAVCIESSTVSLAWISELSSHALAKGLGFLDAPVTGSKTEARNGALRFLVGGAKADIEKARPVLEVLSREVIELGPVGSGTKMKLVNNFLCGVHAATLAEALTMAERSGLNLQTACNVLTTGAPGSPIVKLLANRIIAGDYSPNFFNALMAKDLACAVEQARNLGIDLETAVAARSRFCAAVDEGLGAVDISSVIEPIRSSQSNDGRAPVDATPPSAVLHKVKLTA